MYLPEVFIVWCVLIDCDRFDPKLLALKHLDHDDTCIVLSVSLVLSYLGCL